MTSRNSLAFRSLVAIARQRPEFHEPRCQALLEMLATSDHIRARVRFELQSLDLTEVQCGVLIVLRALDPEPVLPATLADHVCVTRGTITHAIDYLQDLALAEQRRSRADRRNRPVSLLKSGRELADRAAVLLLHALAAIGRPLEDPAPHALHVLCDRLMAGAGVQVVNTGQIKLRNGNAGGVPATPMIITQATLPRAPATQSKDRNSQAFAGAQLNGGIGSNLRTGRSEEPIPQCAGW